MLGQERRTVHIFGSAVISATISLQSTEKL